MFYTFLHIKTYLSNYPKQPITTTTYNTTMYSIWNRINSQSKNTNINFWILKHKTLFVIKESSILFKAFWFYTWDLCLEINICGRNRVAKHSYNLTKLQHFIDFFSTKHAFSRVFSLDCSWNEFMYFNSYTFFVILCQSKYGKD